MGTWVICLRFSANTVSLCTDFPGRLRHSLSSDDDNTLLFFSQAFFSVGPAVTQFLKSEGLRCQMHVFTYLHTERAARLARAAVNAFSRMMRERPVMLPYGLRHFILRCRKMTEFRDSGDIDPGRTGRAVPAVRTLSHVGMQGRGRNDRGIIFLILCRRFV